MLKIRKSWDWDKKMLIWSWLLWYGVLLILIGYPGKKIVFPYKYFSKHYSFQSILSILKYKYFWPILGGNQLGL